MKMLTIQAVNYLARSTGLYAEGNRKVQPTAGARRSRPRSRRLADRIEEQRIGCQRLTTILRAKAEEDDAALAHGGFDERSFAFNPIGTQQPARKQRIFVSRIPGNYLRLNLTRAPFSNFKHRRVLDPGNRFLRHPGGYRIRRIQFNPQNRSRHIEIRARQTIDHITHRQLELLDRKIRRAIETDKRAARLDKFTQGLHALLAESASVFIRH